MGVYAKLQKVRCELSKSELKKSGKNKHMGFGYFELGDFLPKIIELCDKHGICTIIKFGEKVVTLKVVDVAEETSTVTFTSPIHPAKLQGNAQPVQNLGATQTFMRRYLYMNAFEISENDIVDASDNKTTNTTKTETKTQQATTGESKRDLGKECRDNIIELYGKENYVGKLQELTEFKGKDGNLVAGLKSLTGVSEKRIQVLHGKLKKLKEDKETFGTVGNEENLEDQCSEHPDYIGGIG